MKDLEIDENSHIAKQVWDVRIGTFHSCARILAQQKVEKRGGSWADYLEAMVDKNNKIVGEAIEKMYDESEDLIDQLVHYHLAIIAFAINASGTLDWNEGMNEIEDLLLSLSESTE